jgi:uncharacterized protein (TIGR03000 family)
MSLLPGIRFGAILASAALTAGVASAQHGHGGGHGGGHAGGHMGGAHMGAVGGAHHIGGVHMGAAHYGGAHYATPHYSSAARGGYYGGLGLGYGLGYGGLGYGLGSYGGLGYGGYGLGYGGSSYYGGVGSGALSYGGYGYPAGSGLSVPAIPGTYYPQYQYVPPPTPLMPPAIDPNAPDPTPLPLPAPGGTPSSTTTPVSGGGNVAVAKLTVLANEGAKVSFDGIASEQVGTRHSFTTKPIGKGVETRVQVKVDGSIISIGVRGGEAATIDMRK